jgi:catechol-2,3-dioxygenase
MSILSSPWISGLRSIDLELPDLSRAEAFYTEVWGLEVAARRDDALYLRGSGRDHHLLALHAASGAPRLRHVTLRASHARALQAIAAATQRAGGRVLKPLAPLHDPAGGHGLTLCDPAGRAFQIVHDDVLRAAQSIAPDRPVRLAHVVLNSPELEATQRFIELALGFVLADRTRIMAFMNCNRDHHTLAISDTDNAALNHIAFLMPSLDAVMRGAGRMKEHGHPIEWGPGRHGPGDNAFNYFIDPFGVVIEYTAEVQQVGEDYRARGPADWTWPPGRVDQWGIGIGPTPQLKQAQRQIFFANTDSQLPEPTR